MSAPVLTFSANNLTDFGIYERLNQRWAPQRRLPFIEILWDNFLHLEPADILRLVHPLADRVALHIMWSRFLELEEAALASYLHTLNRHIRTLDPIYVSDHLCRFRERGFPLSIPLEVVPYKPQAIKGRVLRYQDAIGRSVLFENYASTESHGREQPQFLRWLMRETDCGLLFDVSNARAAQLNGIALVSDWSPLLAGTHTHGHVGSYKYRDDTQLYHDTHDSPISDDVIRDLTTLKSINALGTLCYERDHFIQEQALLMDLQRLDGCFS
jgi:uncharacterized protein (UPF0276 family)